METNMTKTWIISVPEKAGVKPLITQIPLPFHASFLHHATEAEGDNGYR